jgi:hypothetical protein
MAFTTTIFTKLPNNIIGYAEISCTEFYLNRVKVVEILAKFHSRLLEKYSLHYIHFFKTHQWPKTLRENLTEIGIQIWKVGREFFYVPMCNTSVTEPTFTFLHFLWKNLIPKFHENLTNSLIVDRPTRSRADGYGPYTKLHFRTNKSLNSNTLHLRSRRQITKLCRSFIGSILSFANKWGRVYTLLFILQ